MLILSVKMTITPTPHWCAIASLGMRCVNEVNGNELVGGQVVAAFLDKLAFCEQNVDLALRKCARKVINTNPTHVSLSIFGEGLLRRLAPFVEFSHLGCT